MHITNGGRVETKKNIIDIPQSMHKNISQMKQGYTFKARVIDIQPKHVTIELKDNSKLTAEAHVLPDAGIGEDVIFQVKENIKGQILLEMLKMDGDMPTNFIKEALKNAKLPITNENMELVNSLLKNNISIDANTLQKATFFRYAEGNLSQEQIIFLLEEGFEANKANIDLLKQMTENNFKINDNIQDIIKSLTENSADDIINKLFPNVDSKEKIKSILENKLYISIENQDSLNDTKEHFKELYKTISDVEDVLKQVKTDDQLLNTIFDTKEQIKFIDQIKNYREFVQIPFILGQEKKQGDLYVFKRNKNDKYEDGQISALLSLDYGALGHIEIFISKIKQSLTMEFRAIEQHSLKMLEIGSYELSNILTKSGYTISGMSYKKIEKNFVITDQSHTRESDNKTRFSFDIRV